MRPIAHARVPARCWSPSAWPEIEREAAVLVGAPSKLRGFVLLALSPRWINLSPEVCRPLRALAGGGRDVSAATAHAVEVLAHEAEHVGGAWQEWKAECWGMQEIAPVAERLGATPAYARRLARLFWERVYPSRPRGYRSPACRDGGPLDLRRASSVWP